MILRLAIGFFYQTFHGAADILLQKRGNILVYIVMIMVIFGLLGALMVSLFSTSISSSATTNETRRAFFLSESGLRYGMSELRNRGFSDSVIDPLNQTVFKLQPSGEFDLNIFSYWFEFDSGPDIAGGGSGTITVDIHKGEIPQGIWSSAPANLFLVYCNYRDLSNPPSEQNPQDSARALVTGFNIDPNKFKSLDIQLSDEGSDGFAPDKGKPQLCFAVKPESDQLIATSTNLRVDEAARDIFPKTDGAIEVNRRSLFYKNAVDKGSYVELTDITFASWDRGSTPKEEQVKQTSDYVVLSPINYVVISKGQSGNVTFGGDMANSATIANRSGDDLLSDFGPENLDYSDTGSFKQNESTPSFFQLDDTEKSITIGGGSGNRFGSIFFRDTRNIGGIRNYCQNGACFFDRGFRAFFILKYSGGDGDGFTFSVINEANNDAGSVGGDVQLSEILAYAGDSRTVASPTGPGEFLDGKGEGLEAPKMAVEFDGRRNNQNETICRDATTVNQGSRFDPDFSGNDRDTVQYVFWGSDNNLINAPCRVNTFVTPNTNKTYDDNRHDAVTKIWEYNSGSRSLSSPVIDKSDPANVKIYTGRSSENVLGASFDQGRLIRLNPADGVSVWTRNPDETPSNDDDIDSSPALDSSGNIYIGNDSSLISRYNSNGTLVWSTPLGGNIGNIEGKPLVSDPENRVYVVTDDGVLFSLRKDIGTLVWSFPIGSSSDNYDYTSSPAVIYNSNISPGQNLIYVGTRDGNLLVIQDTGGFASERGRYSASGPIRSTPAINPVNENVYFGSDDNKVHAITNSGGYRWDFTTGDVVVSSPEVTADGSILYIGSNDGHLYALNTANGSQIWKYPATGQIGAVRSSPTITSDGAIYFGSDDGHLYALNSDGTLRWQYPPAGATALDWIRSKPAVAPNGIIYFTTENPFGVANEGKLYAIDPAFNVPPNIPYLYLTPAQLDPANAASYSNNWFTLTDAPNGWAVRIEVERSLNANGSGKYEYTLNTWMKKCQDAGCTNVLGKFFQNTRFEYDYANEFVPITPLTQTIELDSDFHGKFERFLFGFTSATTDPQNIEISKFQLSFIRPNDPVVHD